MPRSLRESDFIKAFALMAIFSIAGGGILGAIAGAICVTIVIGVGVRFTRY